MLLSSVSRINSGPRSRNQILSLGGEEGGGGKRIGLSHRRYAVYYRLDSTRCRCAAKEEEEEEEEGGLEEITKV